MIGQVLVTSIGYGIKGNEIKCMYNEMKSDRLLNDIGETLLCLCKTIPDGMLVFVSSYGIMDRLRNKWTEDGIIDKMTKYKNLHFEPKGGEEETLQFLNEIESFGIKCGSKKYINARKKRKKLTKKDEKRKTKKNKKNFKKTINYAFQKQNRKNKLKSTEGQLNYEIKSSDGENDTSSDGESDFEEQIEGVSGNKGAMFFGVCRGKISEGIDFSDGMSRAVIILGFVTLF